MPQSKQDRAHAIVTKILADDKERPAIDPRSPLPTRMVGDPRGVSATLTLGHRFNAGPAYGTRTERRPIRDAKWIAVSVYDRGKEVLAVNVCGSSFHIALYRPGPWERTFGVDWQGDDRLHQWGDPPIGDDVEEQTRIRKRDLELDPTRGHPPVVDELRTSVMRPRRARDPQFNPAGPLTVSLKAKFPRRLSS